MRGLAVAAITLALCLVVAELASAQQQQGSSAGQEDKKRPLKIRRTIRVKAEEPAETGAKDQPNVEIKNVGPTNQIDVQPNISIGAPSQPDQQQQQQPAASAADESNLAIVAHEPQQQQLELNDDNVNLISSADSNNQLLTETLNSNNVHANALADSHNKQFNLAEGSGNSRQAIMRNSGNTEEVHIEGVGNKKITKISNAANHEEEEEKKQTAAGNQLVKSSPLQQPVQMMPQLEGLKSPLVQINMNSEDLSKTPASQVPTLPIILSPAGAPASMQNPQQEQQVMAAMQGPRQMLPPTSVLPVQQMASPVYLTTPQLAQQSPLMMMLQPIVYPQIVPTMMEPPREEGSTCCEPRLMRELKRLREENRRLKHKRQRAVEEIKLEEAKPQANKEVVVVMEQKKPKVTTPDPVIVIKQPQPQPQAAELEEAHELEQDDEEEEEEEEEEKEEVVRWVTERTLVPKKKKVVIRSKGATPKRLN